jgi:hypothetical protein
MSSERKDTPEAPKPVATPKRAWEAASAYTYVGPGIVPGVPDHDLEPWEVARLPIDLLREVAHSPYYTAAKANEGGR